MQHTQHTHGQVNAYGAHKHGSNTWRPHFFFPVLSTLSFSLFHCGWVWRWWLPLRREVSRQRQRATIRGRVAAGQSGSLSIFFLRMPQVWADCWKNTCVVCTNSSSTGHHRLLLLFLNWPPPSVVVAKVTPNKQNKMPLRCPEGGNNGGTQ